MTRAVHRLTDSQFDDLASGWGDLGGELLAGQVSKRVLQILALLHEIPTRYPDSAVVKPFTEGYDLIAALRQRAPAAVDALLRYPQVGAWVAHALRRLLRATVGDRSLDDDLGHICGIAAAAALTAGEGFDLTLRVRADRSLMIPMFGLARF